MSETPTSGGGSYKMVVAASWRLRRSVRERKRERNIHEFDVRLMFPIYRDWNFLLKNKKKGMESTKEKSKHKK